MGKKNNRNILIATILSKIWLILRLLNLNLTVLAESWFSTKHKFSLLSRFMVTESYDYHEVDKTMMYYSTPLVKEADFPFNFYLLDLPQNISGTWAKHLVNLWMGNMPTGLWANWVVSPYRYCIDACFLGFIICYISSRKQICE